MGKQKDKVLSVREIKELNSLLIGLLPEMDARVSGLQELWPGGDVIECLHRNKTLVRRIRSAIELTG